jgi:hypothetical protein
MTEQEALAILDQVTSLTPLNREQHTKVVEALKVFESLIKNKKE